MNRVSKFRSPFESDAICGVNFTVGAEAVNVITVSVQLLGQDNLALGRVAHCDWFLSGAADGTTLATAMTGGVAAGTDGLVVSAVAGRWGWATSEADGTIDFALTDTGTPTVYLCIRMPDGSLEVSPAITFA